MTFKDLFYALILISGIAWNYYIEARLEKVEEESKVFHTKVRKHGEEKNANGNRRDQNKRSH